MFSQRNERTTRNMNICEVCIIGITNFFDIFCRPSKFCKYFKNIICCECFNCCKCCKLRKCCRSEKCFGYLDCCKNCDYEEDLGKECSQELDYEELREGANQLNSVILNQIIICKQLKKEEEKIGETSNLKGNLSIIKMHYKELTNLLNEE